MLTIINIEGVRGAGNVYDPMNFERFLLYIIHFTRMYALTLRRHGYCAAFSGNDKGFNILYHPPTKLREVLLVYTHT